MFNKDEGEYLEHYGTLGMKWRIRRGEKKADKLSNRADKMIARFDRKGRYNKEEITKTSKKLRRLEYKNNKRIRKIEKYLGNKRLVDIMFNMKKDPAKVEKVKEHLAKSELQKKKLSEIRSTVNTVKLDLM